MKIFVIFLIKLFALLAECNSSPISSDASTPELTKKQGVGVLNEFFRILNSETNDVIADITRMQQLTQQIRLIKNFSSDPSADYDEIVIIKNVSFDDEIFPGNAQLEAVNTSSNIERT